MIEDKQQATADWLVRELTRIPANRGAVLNLAGSDGAGKTSILHIVEGMVRKKGLVPLLINPPAGEADTGPIALLDTAAQLDENDYLNGEVAILRDPRRKWDEKMAAVTGILDDHRQDVVLLCHEPALWARQQDPLLDDQSDDRAREFCDWLAEGATCRRIFSGGMPDGMTPINQTRAPRLDSCSQFIKEHQWEELAPVAKELSEELPDATLHPTVWEMKLLVALARVKTPREVASQARRPAPVAVLLEELLDLLERAPSGHLLCKTLTQLSLLRTPVECQQFDGLTQSLSQLDRDLILVCLCEVNGNLVSLRPLVRQDVVRRSKNPWRWQATTPWKIPAADRRLAHRRIRAFYDQYERPSLRIRLESLHHDLLGGESGGLVADDRLSFVEQLHEIGRTFSYLHRDHQRAAEVYRLALGFDQTSAYSHHYLAFNLDWLARNADEVEEHYREAIRLQPTHPWRWSRWISYLATRGRFKQARAEWREALDAMSIGEDSHRWLFMALHRWVARWLLHWGELDFAEDVLSSIPAGVSDTDASIQGLWDLLKAMRHAERGVAVFPLTVPAKDWAAPAPHTDLPSNFDGRPLRSWLPARVECVDAENEVLCLMAAERPTVRDEQMVYMEISLSREQVEAAAHQFGWDDLSEGRFVELGKYGDEGFLRIGLHKDMVWKDRRLIPLVPPPDRWYQRAVARAWASTAEST